jgi:hypothetical protein
MKVGSGLLDLSFVTTLEFPHENILETSFFHRSGSRVDRLRRRQLDGRDARTGTCGHRARTGRCNARTGSGCYGTRTCSGGNNARACTCRRHARTRSGRSWPGAIAYWYPHGQLGINPNGSQQLGG